ncbi:MAG: FAD-dependent monooxygenase [Desulfoplanes sp.]|nr:FAD-dependent monooxygenase [Desulfoplanes sp.]
MTMIRITQIKVPIDHTTRDLHQAAAEHLGIDQTKIMAVHVRRQSIDARKRSALFFVYTRDLELAPETAILDASRYRTAPDMHYTPPSPAPRGDTPRPVIIGAGPCGLFAALILAQSGYRPLLLDRGREAQERSTNVDYFWKTGILDPESNVQFGEGGAGTFSDGKLNTGIKDHGNRCRKVLEEFVAAGAPEDILYDSHPHMGTDLLVSIVQKIRKSIIALGGEVRFQSKVTGIHIEKNMLRGLIINDGEEIETRYAIVAIGHSARDTFALLKGSGVAMEQKPFSIGCRIEHPQKLVDQALYGVHADHPKLGPAPYNLVHHCKNGRSVYTFCMCPGGEVIAAASEPGYGL